MKSFRSFVFKSDMEAYQLYFELKSTSDSKIEYD